MLENFDYTSYSEDPQMRIEIAQTIITTSVRLPAFRMLSVYWLGGFGSFWDNYILRPNDIDIAFDTIDMKDLDEEAKEWLAAPLEVAFQIPVHPFSIPIYQNSFTTENLQQYLGNARNLYGIRPKWLR